MARITSSPRPPTGPIGGRNRCPPIGGQGLLLAEAHHVGDAVVAAGGVATVDGDGLAADEAGVRGQQEGGDGRDLFKGPKEAMLPVHDELLKFVRGLGKDVELAPKQAYVSVRRATQFACIHPSTKTRVDLGIKLKGVEPTGKLEAAGSWNAMVTHRVRLESVKDIDAKVRGWLKKAYEQAG